MGRIQHIADIATQPGHASKRVEFMQIAPAQRSLAPSPLFLLGPANATVTSEIFAGFGVAAVGCYQIAGATVAPTGIAIAGDTAFSSASFLHLPYHVANVAGRINREPLPPRFVPGPLAVIYGPSHETYGHWLVDFLPRLWVLASAGYALERLFFLIPPDLSPLARGLLGMVGIRPDQLVTYGYWRELIHTDLLLMPTGLRQDNRVSPHFAEATRFWVDRLRHHTEIADTRFGPRIFLSRGQAPQGREMVNRDEIEALAREGGYAVLVPERLSLPEQMAMFAGAKLVVGEYGSALHGSVFAPPGTLVCGLRGNSRHPSFVQSGIAAALRQAVGYVFGDTAGQDVMQRFTVARADFKRALEAMAIYGAGL